MESDNGTYVQCQQCGKISKTSIPVDIEDLFLTKYQCDQCGCRTGLNLGKSQDDIYMYMNSNVDYRYYDYNRYINNDDI